MTDRKHSFYCMNRHQLTDRKLKCICGEVTDTDKLLERVEAGLECCVHPIPTWTSRGTQKCANCGVVLND